MTCLVRFRLEGPRSAKLHLGVGFGFGLEDSQDIIATDSTMVNIFTSNGTQDGVSGSVYVPLFLPSLPMNLDTFFAPLQLDPKLTAGTSSKEDCS